MTHPRNTEPMRESRRCGATTRAGTPCRAPAVCGKKRCRMHGGANGSGAPLGNRNAFKHGEYSKKAILRRQVLRELLRDATELLAEIDPPKI